MKERIENLRATIDHHNHQYYVLGQPEIPDSRFDEMFRSLLELETQYPEFYDPNSPTSRIGSDLANDFQTFRHLSPMLSVNSVETIDELNAFIDRGDTICQLKYDGCGVSLIYEKGKLTKALTRGDGFKGMDVTANLRTFNDVPYTVNTTETIEVRGEVWCPYSELQRMKKSGIKVHSPVAVASNSIKIKLSAVADQRKLRFTAFHVVGADLRDCPTHTFNLLWLVTNQFQIPEDFPIRKVVGAILHGCPIKYDPDIPADGLIFKHDDLNQCKSEGANSRVVNWAISYKFDKDLHKGIVAGIGGKIAANGLVTHYVFIKPLTINNEVITKISVTTALLDTSIEVGQPVAIRRKGTRIAQIIVQTGFKHVSHYCPQCSTPLIRRKSLLFCPAKCHNISIPPDRESYQYEIEFDPLAFSIDPPLAQFIAHQNNCLVWPISESNEFKLYYNTPSELATIGYAIGDYSRINP